MEEIELQYFNKHSLVKHRKFSKYLFDDDEHNQRRSSFYFFGSVESMGKCVSKQEPNSLGQFGNGDSTSYIAISEKSDELSLDDEGQSESKKNAKRAANGVETKGTAMSFGFKKKTHGFLSKSNKKQHDKDTELKFDNDKRGGVSTVIVNPSIIQNNGDSNILDDKNGNIKGSLNSLDGNETSSSQKSGTTGRTTPRLLPPKKDSSGLPYRPNRFGFRQTNIVRPASAGLTPKLADNDCHSNNINNNINNNFINVKPRSKSAGTAANNSTQSITPNSNYLNQHQQQMKQQQKINETNRHHQQQLIDENLKIKSQQNSTQSQQQQSSYTARTLNQYKQEKPNYSSSEIQQQMSCAIASQYINKSNGDKYYTMVNTDLHTNPIVIPIPQTASISDSVSKFTLHTTNLPKPQFAIPISLPPRNVMDTKVAKQALNSSRRGFQGPREISSDSGIASFDSYGDQFNTSPRRSSRNTRPRNLQMIMKGRNAFEVRDFDDSLSDESIVPLVLPKLPSAFNACTQQVSLDGLIRNDHGQNINDDFSSSEMRKLSLVSSDIGSLEEEMEEEEEVKLSRDKSITEKCMKTSTFSINSKNSSPASSRASWDQGGETMANNDCSSLSISSSDESKLNNNKYSKDLFEEDEISSITITTGVALSSLTVTAPTVSYSKYDEIADEQTRKVTIPQSLHQPKLTTRSVVLTIKDQKFAEMAEAVGNDCLLDDETSPTDSLVSSCTDSDELVLKKNKKRVNDAIKEQNEFDEEERLADDCNNDISPDIDLTSPMSPGTPTHASNSFSLSDAAGRDFLIDDEIADQPELVFDDGKNDDIGSTSLMLQSLTENTPTLIESCHNPSYNNNNNYIPNNNSSKIINLLPKPKARLISGPSPLHSGSTQSFKPKNLLITRTESLDTLSPCESIASDDMMMDFEFNSSMDSIDRGPHSYNGSGSGSALHSMDEIQLLSEIDANSGDIVKEWTQLLRGHKPHNNKDITTQLPARATRLLNRSRLSQAASATDSDSPRSLDSVSRRATLLKSHTYQVPEDMVLVDKSVRNSMLQDVVHFKKQLVRLRRLLQEEDEDVLMRTETLNPFEHGQFFANCGIDLLKQTTTSTSSLDDRDSGSLTPSITDDPKQELADLRRQVVFLQGQLDDKDRTIRLQQSLINKLEDETDKHHLAIITEQSNPNSIETVNSATQTERIRPLSMGHDGLSRSEEKHQNNIRNLTNNIRQHHKHSSSSSSTSAIAPPTIIINNNKNLTNSIKTVRTIQTGNIYATKKLREPEIHNHSNNQIVISGDKLRPILKIPSAPTSPSKLQISPAKYTSNSLLSPSKKIPTFIRTQQSNINNINNYGINNINNKINLNVNEIKNKNGNSSGNSSLNSSSSSLNSKLICSTTVNNNYL